MERKRRDKIIEVKKTEIERERERQREKNREAKKGIGRKRIKTLNDISQRDIGKKWQELDDYEKTNHAQGKKAKNVRK